MKILLFLYPIEPYIDHFVKNYPSIPNILDRLNQLLEIRYRKQGYIIYWVIFSKPGDRNTPDLDIIDKRVSIFKEDILVSAGVSFASHTKKKMYPRPSRIFKQLPPSLTEVRVAGFHQYDCVDRQARYIYRQDIEVVVDEDLTDRYFSFRAVEEFIPDNREFTMNGFGYNYILDDEDHFLRNRIISFRRRHPWFVQPRNDTPSVQTTLFQND